MDRRTAVLGTLGVLITLVSAAFVVAPDLLLALEPVAAGIELLSAVGPGAMLTVATLVAVLYVVVVARSPAGRSGVAPASDAERRFDRAATEPPETVTANRRRQTAADLDADVAAAVENGGDRLETLRETLAETATTVYAEFEEVERAEARRAVETGDWTDDRIGTAFLAEQGGPMPPLTARVRLWLTPARERRRRIERTVAAIRRLAGETR